MKADSSETPLVSFIIACYNAEAYIVQTLQSICNQTYQNIEIIIINDGSTDHSVPKIKSFADPRIILLEQENKGQCAALNQGLRIAKGAYIKFFDADDLLCREHIELQMQAIAGRKDVVASCEWYRFFQDDLQTAVYAPETVWKNMKPLDWLKQSLMQRYDMMPAWLWLIPRELMERSGEWNEALSLNNDFEFSVRLLLNAREVIFTKGAKVYYRSGRGMALSETASRKAYEAAILSTDLACSYLLAADDSGSMKQLCADRYQEWCFRIYPRYADLIILLEEKIKQLGGSHREMDGGKVFRMTSKLFGWKKAKRIKYFFYTIGYSQLFPAIKHRQRSTISFAKSRS